MILVVLLLQLFLSNLFTFQVRPQNINLNTIKTFENLVYKEGADESTLFWWQIYEKYFNKEQADSVKEGFQNTAF